jgi:hypothetical protein
MQRSHVESLFTFDVERMLRGVTPRREESLFTIDEERSHSSNLPQMSVERSLFTFFCEEVSLFTYHVERSHSSHAHLEWSHSSYLLWRGVTLHISCGEDSHFSYSMGRGITLHT